MDRVVEFYAIHGLGIVGYWMPLSVRLFLRKNAGDYTVGSVSF